MTPANWIAVGALIVSLVMAVVNITNGNKAQKKDDKEGTEKATERTTGIMIALENIKNQLTRIENEINTVKQDNRENHDKLLIMEQSQKSEHKRLDAHEQRLNNIERQLRIAHYRDTDTGGE